MFTQRRRSGVVAAMLAACARTSAGQADASKALVAALTSLHDEGKVGSISSVSLGSNHVVALMLWAAGASQTRPAAPGLIQT